MLVKRAQFSTDCLQEHLGVNLRVVDASKEFYAGLKGIAEPEKKRKFIGGAFIDAFEAEVCGTKMSLENLH